MKNHFALGFLSAGIAIGLGSHYVVAQVGADNRTPIGPTIEVFDEPCIARLAETKLADVNNVFTGGVSSVGPALLVGGTDHGPEFNTLLVTGNRGQNLGSPSGRRIWNFCGPRFMMDQSGQCVLPAPQQVRFDLAPNALAMARIEAARDNRCIRTLAAPITLANDIEASRGTLREIAATLRAIRERLPAQSGTGAGLAPPASR